MRREKRIGWGRKQSPSGTVSDPYLHPAGWPDPEFSLWGCPPMEIVLSKVSFKSSYGALLRNPKWQKARLETMQRANFACEKCGDKDSTLNVHHKNYKPGRNPWEYELSNFVCLCESCHEHIHEQKQMINNLLPYCDLDFSEIISGFVSDQDNSSYVGSLHPRVFSDEEEIALGKIIARLNSYCAFDDIYNFAICLDDRDFLDDFEDLLNTHIERISR